ncbi:MAG: Xaa-Pro peptidase family protein [Bryobacteraceae bacterium]|jgi:Xaa-Pro aminopeptidase
MGRAAKAIAVWLSACLSVAAAIAPAEFATRRASLQKQLDGTLVLFGRAEAGEGVDGLHQEANLYYLTGWAEPGAVVLFTHSSATLFLPAHDEKAERYTGRHASAEDAGVRARTGFDNVRPLVRFESEFAKALETSEKVYALPDDTHTPGLKALAPLRTVQDAAPLITALRVKKSAAEIDAIQHSTDVSIEAHRAAWKHVAPGLNEYQLAAVMSETVLDHGCERFAYAPIIGSGPNGAVLHYDANRGRMGDGELVVMDVAGECAGYASDITRTVPVNGRFTPRQLELYNIVLAAQKAAIVAVKPGVLFWTGDDSPDAAARKYIETHGKDLHGESLGKYFTHKIGHGVGLEVHDPPMPPAKLEEGMVITIEPGVYIPEEKIGIRIEDVVLVTASGSRVLSAALPKEPKEIEKALAR